MAGESDGRGSPGDDPEKRKPLARTGSKVKGNRRYARAVQVVYLDSAR